MTKKRNKQHGNKILGTPLDYKKHGDGINDPNLVLDYDSRFSDVLGTGISRRNLLKAGAAVAGLGLGGMSPLSSAFASKKEPFDPVVRMGYIPITDAAALLVAHELGYFKDEGIDSEKPTLIRGWAPLVEAFASHRFNLTHMLAPIPIWMRYNNNYPVKVTAWDHTNGSAMVVHKDSGIKSPKNMGGKQFAMPFWYSMHNIVSQMLLKDHGITPVIRPQNAEIGPNECNFLVLNPPDMPPALASRQIDGYCVAEPFCAMGEVKAQGEILRFNGDIWKGHPCCVVVMHEDDAMDPDRAAWAQGVHNAIIRAQLYLGANRKEMSHMLSKDGKKYLPFPVEIVERAMMFYDPAYYNNPQAIQNLDWEQDRINFQAWPYPSATVRIVDELKKTTVTGDSDFLKNITGEHVAKDLVQYEYVKNSLEKYPDWKKDPSVPQSGNPYEREEVIKT
ncbi:ABC transporter substrate-binding protein [Sulfuriflexus sp.]|uniref:ABC transporter substrate-binding protein n=1 Tax=Sulfuriflexus sp. TaxID=2015443 RepID=UPI0028CDB1B4|nr:ABC transporter substrate-binding protein [Sulfuriflexus sp.]MDT8404239.1 ABC transporter substrate-binding protein [Sulfuriflexus sp.]